MKDPDLTSMTPTAPEFNHAAMRRLGKAATKVFMALIAGIPVGDARKIDNAGGAFMAVSVDHLARDSRGGSLYAVAHRYEANGDLVPDPDVEFYVVDDPAQPGDKAIYPTAIDHGPLGYYRHVHFDSAGQPARVASRGQAALATFCDDWMRNIARQQGLVLS
jgi:hypothetical protein